MSDNPAPDTTDKVQPDGAPIPTDDAALERAAKITPADIARSRANARRHDTQFAALLNAKRVK